MHGASVNRVDRIANVRGHKHKFVNRTRERSPVLESRRLPRVRQHRRSSCRGAPRSRARRRARSSSTSLQRPSTISTSTCARVFRAFRSNFPHTAGVEPVGGISAIGDGVDGLGDRRSGGGVSHRDLSGRAVYCRTGRESLCTAPDWFIGMGSGGAYAEMIACKASQLIRIPDGVTDVEAAAALDRVRNRLAHAGHARASSDPGRRC